MKRFSETLCHVVLISFVLLLVGGAKTDEHSKKNSDNKCTKIKRTEKVAAIYESGPCVKSFKARCGWFSLDLCTFYKKEICDKNSNITQYMYSSVYVCCDGYIEVPNGTCISLESADPKWVVLTENNTDVVYVNIEDIPTTTTTTKLKPLKHSQTVDKKEEGLGISRGALAGAACAIVFLIVVIAFTIIGVRKRRKRQAKNKPQIETERDEAGQQMLTTAT